MESLYRTDLYHREFHVHGFRVHTGGVTRAPCALVVAYDTKDKCGDCDSTALDSLGFAWLPSGGSPTVPFVIGPITNHDSNDDGGLLDIVVRVYAQNSERCWDQSYPDNWFVTVLDSTGERWHYDTQLYSNVSADTLDLGELIPIDPGSRGSLHLMRTVAEKGWAWAKGRVSPSQAIAPVRVRWSHLYSENPIAGGTFYDRSSGDIYVDGRNNASALFPDEWDDPVVIHEYGKHVAMQFGALGDIAGNPSVCNQYSDSLGWNEGWASFYACFNQARLGFNSNYVDVGVDPDGSKSNFTMNLETGCVTPACPGGCAYALGAGNEVAVGGALWDIYDAVNDNPNGDGIGDLISDGPNLIWSTLVASRPHTALAFQTAYVAANSSPTGNFQRYWRLRQLFWEHGIGVPLTSIEEEFVPKALTLMKARPNPFNPRTRIGFFIPGSAGAMVRLTIFDVRGARVRDVVRSVLAAGLHEVEWDGRDETGGQAASGVYFCKLWTPMGERSMKMVLAK